MAVISTVKRLSIFCDASSSKNDGQDFLTSDYGVYGSVTPCVSICLVFGGGTNRQGCTQPLYLIDLNIALMLFGLLHKAVGAS